MRVIQAALLLIFLAIVGIFALQNMQAVTVRFLDRSVTAPVAVTAVIVYLLGMLSGWTVVAFVRRSLRGIHEAERKR
jgi:uncharacterized integral membrane protein